MDTASLPVAVIGAGPVGLAAAAHLLGRGITPLILEAGDAAGASVREWRHVRFFSPWRYAVDGAARALLEAHGWAAPDPEGYPTGRDLLDQYLVPLAALPEIAPHLRTGSRVLSVTRRGVDKMKTGGREDAPFVLRVRGADGREGALLARAVIDASGTWATPNPLGADGVPALGERALARRIRYGIPDVLGAERARYAGRRVLVVGSGHSAFNALQDLAELARQEPGTAITWAIRRAALGQVFGGGADDELAERGALGRRIRELVEAGTLRVAMGFKVTALHDTPDGVVVSGEEGDLGPVDRIVATTGFRPDLSLASELRLGLDPALESPTALAGLIDPNVHSCGTVPPHGADELAHPERDFYIVGMKSYGRAPTFLLLTGYEQVRSVVAALAGDWAAARDVRLELPESGVCSSGLDGASCCAAPVAQTPIALALPGRAPVRELALAGAGPHIRESAVPIGVEAQAACCAPSEQETCCAPSEKAACCGTAAATVTCGCR